MDVKLRKKLEKWLAGRGVEETIITAMSDEDLIKHTIGYVQDVEPLLAWTEHFASIVPGGAVTSEGDEPGPGPQPHEVTEAIEWEYINSEEAWNASYASGALKKYYEDNPSDDLWNTKTNTAPGFNDKVYKVHMWTNPDCTGEYEERIFKAQYFSDPQNPETSDPMDPMNGTQKIIDVNDPSIEYYLPLFYNTPKISFELFANVYGSYAGTVKDLINSCSRWIIVQEVDWGEDVTHAWKGALNAPDAKLPWLCVSFDDVEAVVKAIYDETTVTPWGTTPRTFAYGLKSIPVIFGHNEWIIPADGTIPTGLPEKTAFTVTRTYTITD